MKKTILLLILVAAALTLGACEDGAITTEPGELDVATADTESSTDADVTAVPVPDVVAIPDTDPAEPCEPGTGCFEEQCDGPDECMSGICVQHVGEKVCSKTCDEECPDGWTCNLVTGGSDGQYVCTSNFSHLCLPCSSPESCAGDTPNACVPYADGGSFCGGACDLNNPCPGGYACQEVETSTGGLSYQCVATSGVCSCSTLAINSSAATPCYEENEHGVCEGSRLCGVEGLSACDAATPAAEICNGVDDDCDGATDNDTCDDGNPCTADTCLGADGCSHEPLDSGECLDGDVCTVADHCEAGVCVGTLVDCGDDNPCTEDSCDGAGGCINAPIVGVCDDGDDCTLGDLCNAEGQCAGGVTLDCDDQNPCTDDACGPQGCVHTPNTNPCDDQNACTSESACLDGVCQATATVVCDDENPCTTDICDPATGCGAVNHALPCDDGDVCTLGDQCADGACVPGTTPLACDDQNGCTDDACDAELGCTYVPTSSACDDGNDCTVMDVCSEGQCMGAGSLACDDGNPCTVDSCLSDGGCAHEAVAGSCSDGDPCTLNDQCVEGQCVSGDDLVCDDQNGCTDDSCDPEVGCVFSANEAECDDGNACTNLDMCWQGTCVAMGTIDCDDGNPCTSDACKPLEGCEHTAIDVPCSDGDPCTTSDTCVAGSCEAGPPLGCEDGNPCTSGTCDSGSCVFSPSDGPCDDSNACTVGNTCADGVCGFDTLLDCNDDNPCTEDSCEPSTGCDHQNNEAPCSDGNVCTQEDACVDGECVPGPALECDDANECTVDSCDALEGCEITDAADETPCGPDDTTWCEQGDCVEAPFCGDGVTQGDEQCDDGNETPGDGCENNCTYTLDGFEEFLEPGAHVFTVPPGIFEIRALAIGGGGSGNYCGGCNGGGGGGGAKSLVTVEPGQQIELIVGRGGGNTGTDAPHLDGGDSSIASPVNILATGGFTQGPGGTGSGGNLHNSKGGSHGGTINAYKIDGVPDEPGDAGGSGSGLQGFGSGPPAGSGLGYGGGGGGQNCQGYGGPCGGAAGGANGYSGGSAGEDGGGPSGGKTGNEADNQWFWDNCSGHSQYNGGGGGSFGGGGGNDGSGQGDAQCAVGLYLGGDGAHGYVRFEWGNP